MCQAVLAGLGSSVKLVGSGDAPTSGAQGIADMEALWLNNSGYSIPSNCAPQVVSVHQYTSATSVLSGTQSLISAASAPPGTAVMLTEWNYDGGSDTRNDDPSFSVGYNGASMLAFINYGFTGIDYYDFGCDTGSTGPSIFSNCNSPTPGLTNKGYVWYLLGSRLGLANGTGTTYSTSVSGDASAATAIINHSGIPVVAVSNYNNTGSDTFTVNFSGLSLSGTVNATVYLVDGGSNHAASPFQTGTVSVSGGSASLTVNNVTAYSMFGVLLTPPASTQTGVVLAQ